MQDTTLSGAKPETAAHYEAIADQLLADMSQLETLMRSDRIEIDRLKAETHLLRQEARRLETETQAALSRLKSVLK